MIPKFSNIILCSLVFALFSCNSEKDKKNNISQEINKTDSGSIIPVNYLLALENRLISDSLSIQTRTTLASNYYTIGNLDKAAYHYQIICRLDPKNLDAVRNLGNIYYDSKQDDKAIECYEKALTIDPDNISMRCDLATCYLRINKVNKAIDILRGNLKKDPNHKQSHYNLSVILKQAGKQKESDEEMKIYNSLISAK